MTTFNTLHSIFIFNCWKQMNALFLKYAVHTHLIQYSTLFRWKECPENMRRWGNNAVQGLKMEEDKFCHKHIMFMFHIFGQSIANGLVGNLSLKKKKIAYNSVTKHLFSDLSVAWLLHAIQLGTSHVPNFGLPWISVITLKAASSASKVFFYWHNMDNIQYCLTLS